MFKTPQEILATILIIGALVTPALLREKMLWEVNYAYVELKGKVTSLEARMIEAEAQLRERKTLWEEWRKAYP